MEPAVRTTSITGILAILLAAAALLPIGCQSSNRVVSSEPSATCPMCERQTRIQPLTGLKYTTCICPTCKQTTTLDPDFALDLERVTGLNIGDRVHVCDSCGKVIEECAACREKRAQG